MCCVEAGGSEFWGLTRQPLETAAVNAIVQQRGWKGAVRQQLGSCRTRICFLFLFPDDDESDEESVKKTNKCSLVWEVSSSSDLI